MYCTLFSLCIITLFSTFTVAHLQNTEDYRNYIMRLHVKDAASVHMIIPLLWSLWQQDRRGKQRVQRMRDAMLTCMGGWKTELGVVLLLCNMFACWYEHVYAIHISCSGDTKTTNLITPVFGTMMYICYIWVITYSFFWWVLKTPV